MRREALHTPLERACGYTPNRAEQMELRGLSGRQRHGGPEKGWAVLVVPSGRQEKAAARRARKLGPWRQLLSEGPHARRRALREYYVRLLRANREGNAS